jgi:hypothetical protein
MCKPSTSAYCLPPVYKDYEDSAKPFLAICNDSTETPNKKRKASEEMGTLAAQAYNAKRHGTTLTSSKTDHEEFRGCGVVDLFAPSKNEIKEAKGGSSSYGDRKDHINGGRVTQCTPEYTEVIIDKMVNSNYNGRHPEVGCTTHSTAPLGTCKDCKQAERKRRRKSGSDMFTAFSTDTLEKHSVRGDYDGECLKEPKKIEAYKIVGGVKVPI